jgi:hypothetical protein
VKQYTSFIFDHLHKPCWEPIAVPTPIDSDKTTRYLIILSLNFDKWPNRAAARKYQESGLQASSLFKHRCMHFHHLEANGSKRKWKMKRTISHLSCVALMQLQAISITCYLLPNHFGRQPRNLRHVSSLECQISKGYQTFQIREIIERCLFQAWTVFDNNSYGP